MDSKILIIGSSGQIGTELVLRLREIYGNENVVASDIRKGNYEVMESGPFEFLDVTSKSDIKEVLEKHQIKEVYLMVAILSVIAEQNPQKAWELNMNSLFNILDLAKDGTIEKVFWPSSIAVFGPDTPKINTPQDTIIKPSTVYGISKLAGEGWCSYYHRKFGVDVRSIRYPGLISWKTQPGGGTTDYAVEIYQDALASGAYQCFVTEDTRLPMMYMDDAISATLQLMDTPSDKITVRSSYNLGATSFTPAQLAESIRELIPDFQISYKPDYRQEIADTWPESIDDSKAREDWGWQPNFGLEEITREMLDRLRTKS